MVADGDVLVVGEKRLVWAKELADAGGVIDGGVEVSVIGDVDRFDEGRPGDGVESSLGGPSTVWFCVGVEKSGEGFAEEGPGAMAERHQWIEYRGLADFNQGWRKQVGSSAGVEVEEVSTDGYADVLLAFQFEGSVGEVGEGKSAVG